MNFPITPTKIIPPKRKVALITRQRLLERLYAMLDNRLGIISAPAGYGKTSLLIDFNHQDELPVCWLSLDELDQDFLRFGSHFIAAIQAQFPEFGPQTQARLETIPHTPAGVDQLVSILVREAYDQIRDAFVFVIDDFHLVGGNKLICDFISRCIQRVDDNFHLIILSRELVTIPDLSLMVSRSEVSGLGAEQLAFDRAEIQTLLQQNYALDLSEAAADRLIQETEGWITGLLLSVQIMPEAMADRIMTAQATGMDLFDYLIHQVFDKQPPEIQQFLLFSSPLSEFSPEKCQQVFSDEFFNPNVDFSEFIQIIIQKNLFVHVIDESAPLLRYHHLFRDFLLEKLAAENKESFQKIQIALASFHARNRDWIVAFDIYQQIGDIDLLMDYVDRACLYLMRQNQFGILEQWFAAIPDKRIEANPKLLSVKGDVIQNLGNVKLGRFYLDKSVDLYESNHSYDDDHFRALTWLITNHQLSGNYQAVNKVADQLINLATQDEYLAHRANGYRHKGQGFLGTV